jgi:hypothetical protein
MQILSLWRKKSIERGMWGGICAWDLPSTKGRSKKNGDILKHMTFNNFKIHNSMPSSCRAAKAHAIIATFCPVNPSRNLGAATRVAIAIMSGLSDTPRVANDCHRPQRIERRNEKKTL